MLGWRVYPRLAAIYCLCACASEESGSRGTDHGNVRTPDAGPTDHVDAGTGPGTSTMQSPMDASTPELASRDASLADADVIEDAETESVNGPLDRAFAESKYSLVKPAAMAPIFGQADSIAPGIRWLVTGYSRDSEGVRVEYGAGDDAGNGHVLWQFPPSRRDAFRAAPAADDPRTYRSVQPYTNRLRAFIEVFGSVISVAIDTEDAVYEARFDAAFTRVEQGKLTGALTREEAERRPLNAGFLCTEYCPLAYCAVHGVNTLSDVLDCGEATPEVDRNGDGTPDAYSVEVRFESERVTLEPG